MSQRVTLLEAVRQNLEMGGDDPATLALVAQLCARANSQRVALTPSVSSAATSSQAALAGPGATAPLHPALAPNVLPPLDLPATNPQRCVPTLAAWPPALLSVVYAGVYAVFVDARNVPSPPPPPPPRALFVHPCAR